MQDMNKRIQIRYKRKKRTPWYSARTRGCSPAQLNPEARPLTGPVDVCRGILAGSPSPIQGLCGPMCPDRGGDEALLFAAWPLWGDGLYDGYLPSRKAITHPSGL
ncbi:hypothetical protein DYD21_18600 [Rhodohalobacter sp. SW132]|nr:hypothetical protein DYD21_18600 [Rhodohalobacter sp. SW132]